MYTIGHQAERGGYTALRDVLMQNARTLWHKTKDLATGKAIIQGDTMEEVWALKDVSFEIRRGEAVGIIGRNGAGKSTLLKVLSRITEPSTGRVTIKGRVASLLEVGTGFHPELSGRENIYLNGTILGMTRKEIKRKFDEIVAFAEVEKYLDTPVKRYSSGMYVRLAFAVAAHLEPEILVVDEVLAVGDAQFQKKCIGKMSQVANTGRTVLFVSHNMAAVQGLCEKAIWFDQGQLQMIGPARSTITAYLTTASTNQESMSVDKMPRIAGGKDIRLIALDLLNENGDLTSRFHFSDRMTMRFGFRILNRRHGYFGIEWTIRTTEGVKVAYGSSSPQNKFLIAPTDDVGCVECHLSELPLTSGNYLISCLISLPHQERIDEVEGAAHFEVVTCDVYATGFNVDNHLALITIPAQWSILNGAKVLLEN